MQPPALSGAQRRRLRALAHGLKPTVQLGSGGRTASFDAAVEAALSSHELIKIRFLDHKDEKRDIAAAIAADLGAQVVGVVGHVVTLYRRAADEGRRRVRLD